MRKRMINPDFFSDPKTGRISTVSQILFIGLWCMADREGYIENDIDYIKIQILPYFKGSVQSNLDDLIDRQLVIKCNYIGKELLNIVNFKKHQSIHPHEAKSPYPSIDSDDVIKCNDMSLPPICISKSISISKIPFEDFWKQYPKKVAKPIAEDRWNKLKLEEQEKAIEVINTKVFLNWMKKQIKDGNDYRPRASVWLKEERWDDDIFNRPIKKEPKQEIDIFAERRK